MTIKELREERKLSQAAMAKALSVNVSTIGHLENGRMKLSPKLAAKIREIYGAEAEEGKAATEYANEIIIQSPMGGEITLDQIAEKLPEIAETVYVRVDQNKLWWVGGDDSWYVEIWE